MASADLPQHTADESRWLEDGIGALASIADALYSAAAPLCRDLAEGAARIRETNARSRRRLRLQSVALASLREARDALVERCGAAERASEQLTSDGATVREAFSGALDDLARARTALADEARAAIDAANAMPSLPRLADEIHLVAVAANAEAARVGEASGIGKIAHTLRYLDRLAMRLAARDRAGARQKHDAAVAFVERAEAQATSGSQAAERARAAAEAVASEGRALADGLEGVARSLQRIDGLVAQNAVWAEEVDALAREQSERARAWVPRDSAFEEGETSTPGEPVENAARAASPAAPAR